MTIITVAHRPIATLNLPRAVGALITRASGIVQAMANNAHFPNPSPPLSQVTQAINDLQAAETAAAARTKGTVTNRNARRAVLLKLLEQLKASVQTTADADAENGASIIQSAGIAVRKAPARAPRAFEARSGAVSGSARLVAVSAGPRASYEWQFSNDGGKTWVSAPVTLQSKTTIAGLVPGSTVLFKVRAVTRTGEGDWSQAASLVVK